VVGAVGDLNATGQVVAVHEKVTSVNTAASPYTVLAADSYLYCDATAGAVVLTLPATSGSGRELTVKKIDSSANACTPTRAGSDVIDGATTVSLTSQWAAAKIIDRATGFWDRAHVNQFGGDVTGVSTANTVKSLNGTLLSGLGTGVLKNTTGTGVPSIAVTGDFPANLRSRSIGIAFDGGGAALVSGGVRHYFVPYSCTIAGWNITVDTGTATVDIWKIASGTAIPTVANTITAAALPAISTGTALHSATLTGWSTAIAANDIVAFKLNAVSGASYVSLVLECAQ
jgi:hypothetical protein